MGNHGASALRSRHPEVAKWDWGVGAFVRVRVFSKKLLTCDGAHFGAKSDALGVEDWMLIADAMRRAAGRAPTGEVTAARGDRSMAKLALSIREWGCGDIGSSVH